MCEPAQLCTLYTLLTYTAQLQYSQGYGVLEIALYRNPVTRIRANALSEITMEFDPFRDEFPVSYK